jgi:multiple sugar transport system permease protein
MTDVLSGWRDRRRVRKAEQQNVSGMDYLQTIPQRVVYLYVPLAIIVFVLLFPFYWMAITAIKPNDQLVNFDQVNPYWVAKPTLSHIKSLLFQTDYLHWMWNTMFIAIVATFLSLVASVLAAYAIVRLRYRGAQTVGGLIFLAYLVPPSILFIPLSLMIVNYGLWDTPWALILTYPTILIPFSTWLLMGYFKSIPFELEECALIDGASRWQILTKIILPLAGPGLISAGIFCFTLCWNEFIYALTFISSPDKKTVPTAILSEMVDGDVYRWGSLMAGALLGSIPVAIIYMFFVNHYVSAMTGAVKE